MNGRGVGAEYLDPHKYAERVVRNILNPKPQQHHWLGVLATRIWMASTFLWTTAWVFEQLILIYGYLTLT